MEYKAYDSYNDTMYFNAQWIDDGKWNLGKMIRNRWFKVSHSIGVLDFNNSVVYTNDILDVLGTPFVVSSEPVNGVYVAYDMTDMKNIIEMNTLQSDTFVIIGSKFEIEDEYK